MGLINKKTMYFYAPIPVIVAVFILYRSLWASSNTYDTFALIRFSLLIIFTHVIAVGDFFEKRVPNKILLAMIAVWGLLVAVNLFIAIEPTLKYLAPAFFGLLIGGGLFLFIYFISRKGIGGGDIKFMAIAGLYLTFPYTLSAMLMGSVITALVSLALLILKRIKRKDQIPMIPFLYAGILVTLFFSR